MGNGVISQIGGWIAFPFTKTIPLTDLIIAVLIIIIVVWFISDGASWPKFEGPAS